MNKERERDENLPEDSGEEDRDGTKSALPSPDQVDRIENDVRMSDVEEEEGEESSTVLELSDVIVDNIDEGEQPEGEEEDFDSSMVERFIGTVINDRYEIKSVIARGGMGVVFKAEHKTLDRTVVVKVLRPEEVQSDTARARFEREARRVCQLDHPNIVTVHDFGYHKDLGYLVMEYVDGITLSDYLKQHGPLTFHQFAPVASAILKGLSEAHRFNIIHRDIKASNIMLTFEGRYVRRVKILDFGLAKLVEGGEDDLTKKSELIGTIAAMAPERILGKEADQRVDLYAFGITAYRMLSGSRPFEGEDVRVLYQHVHDDPPLLTNAVPDAAEIPETVMEFVHRLLAKNPDDRPADAGEARTWLYSTVENSSVFRLDEQKVPWLDEEGADRPDSSSTQVTPAKPSWAGAPNSGSFRSVLKERPDSSKLDLDEIDSPTAAISETVNFKWAGMAVAGIAAIAAFGWFLISSSSKTNPEGGSEATAKKADRVAAAGSESTSDAVQEKGSDQKSRQEQIQAVFKEIESSVEEGNFGKAKTLLKSVGDSLASHPELLAQAADYRTRIKVGKKLAEAKRLDRSNKIEQALQKYNEVLSLQAGNETAKERSEKLSSSIFLEVRSGIRGTVYVDGENLGKTPVSELIPAEASTVRVERSGYRDWVKHLSADGGIRKSLTADLEPVSHAPAGGGGGRESESESEEESEKMGIGSGESTEEGSSSGSDFGSDNLMEMND